VRLALTSWGGFENTRSSGARNLFISPIPLDRAPEVSEHVSKMNRPIARNLVRGIARKLKATSR